MYIKMIAFLILVGMNFVRFGAAVNDFDNKKYIGNLLFAVLDFMALFVFACEY